MVRTEVIMMCVDNTNWILQEHNRFSFQIDVFHKLYADKIKSNPKNLVGVSTLAGETDGGTMCILADPSYNRCKHMSCMHDLVYVDGPLDLKHGLQLAEITSSAYLTSNDLLLRLVVFAGGPVKDDKEDLELIGKKFKDKSIAVDVVNFGEEDKERKDKLEALVAAVNNNCSSHIVHIPSASTDDLPILLRSRVFRVMH